MKTTSNRGYSLIELVIVMLLLGIMASVAAPRYIDSLAATRVEAAAKRIAADLNLVRARAIMKGPAEEEWVKFYPADDKYEMVQDPDLDHPGQDYWVEFAKTGYPVDLVSVAFTNDQGFTSNQLVKFDLHGRAKVGNSPNIFPLATGEIIVASGSQQRNVEIDPVTGEARAE